jgi:hypothetical protein
MPRDPYFTPEYQQGLRQAFTEAAMHMRRMNMPKDAEMFERWARRAQEQAEKGEPA